MGQDSLKVCLGYDIKQSDGEASGLLGLWEMRSTPSVSSLSGPLYLGVVAPDKVLSMGQIKLYCNYPKLNCLKLTVFHLTMRKQKKRIKSRNKNVPIFLLVGVVSHRLAQSTKIYVDKKGEYQRWRSGMWLGWWFSDHAVSIKSRSRKVKTSVVWCWIL